MRLPREALLGQSNPDDRQRVFKLEVPILFSLDESTIRRWLNLYNNQDLQALLKEQYCDTIARMTEIVGEVDR